MHRQTNGARWTDGVEEREIGTERERETKWQTKTLMSSALCATLRMCMRSA